MTRCYGFSETMQTMWIYNMQLCAKIHAADE